MVTEYKFQIKDKGIIILSKDFLKKLNLNPGDYLIFDLKKKRIKVIYHPLNLAIYFKKVSKIRFKDFEEISFNYQKKLYV